MAVKKQSGIASAPEMDPNLKQFLVNLQAIVGNALIGQETVPEPTTPANEKATTGKKGRGKPAPEPEEDDDDDRAARQKELEGMTAKALQKVAIDAGFSAKDVKAADTETLIQSILDDEFDGDDEDDDDQDDSEETDEEDEDGEEDGYSREDLEAVKTLKALRAIATDEYEIPAADLKGLDKDGIIDLLLGEDEDEDPDDDDEEDDEPYTEDDLSDMSLKDLKQIAEDWELKVRPGAKAPALIKAILAAQEEDDEDDE